MSVRLTGEKVVGLLLKNERILLSLVYIQRREVERVALGKRGWRSVIMDVCYLGRHLVEEVLAYPRQLASPAKTKGARKWNL